MPNAPTCISNAKSTAELAYDAIYKIHRCTIRVLFCVILILGLRDNGNIIDVRSCVTLPHEQFEVSCECKPGSCNASKMIFLRLLSYLKDKRSGVGMLGAVVMSERRKQMLWVCLYFRWWTVDDK